jgi:hypothetical protein
MQTRDLYIRAGRRQEHTSSREDTAQYIRTLMQNPPDADAARGALLRLASELPAATDNLPEVLRIAEELTARSPRDPRTVAALRLCHVRMGDEAQAEAIWRAYESANPRYRVTRAREEFSMLIRRAVEDGLVPARLLPGS